MTYPAIGKQQIRRRQVLITASLLVVLQAPPLAGNEQHVSAAPNAPMIPAAGSEWIYRVNYLRSDSWGQPQKVKVFAIDHGIPVFSVQLGNYAGKLFQDGEAVVGVAAQCPYQSRPKATERPNLCGWGPCSIRVGESITRDFFAITPLSRCSPVKGHIRHVGKASVEVDVLGGRLAAVRSEASFAIPGLGRTEWSSFIANGQGEVHAESPGRRAEYRTIAVTLTPYLAAAAVTNAGNDAIGPQRVASAGPAAAIAPVRRQPAQSLIVAVGDSLTRGVGVAADQTYPSALQRQMPETEIINAGLAGSTIADTHARIEELRAFRSDLLLLNIGANDMHQGVPRAEFASALRSLVICLKPAARRLILLGLEVDEANPYRGVFREVARDTGVDLIPNVVRGVYRVPEMLGADRLHPNEKGYARIAENVLRGIQAISLESFVGARPRR